MTTSTETRIPPHTRTQRIHLSRHQDTSHAAKTTTGRTHAAPMINPMSYRPPHSRVPTGCLPLADVMARAAVPFEGHLLTRSVGTERLYERRRTCRQGRGSRRGVQRTPGVAGRSRGDQMPKKDQTHPYRMRFQFPDQEPVCPLRLSLYGAAMSAGEIPRRDGTWRCRSR